MILTYTIFALLMLMASRPNGKVEGGMTKRESEDDAMPVMPPPMQPVMPPPLPPVMPPPMRPVMPPIPPIPIRKLFLAVIFVILVFFSRRQLGIAFDSIRISDDTSLGLDVPTSLQQQCPFSVGVPGDPCKFAFCAKNPNAVCRPSSPDMTKAVFLDDDFTTVIKDCGTECKNLCFTREYSPQCGSDGVTYSSECNLNLAKCKSNGKLGHMFKDACPPVDPCKNGFCAKAPHALCRAKLWDFTKPEFLTYYDKKENIIEDCGTVCKNTCEPTSVPVCGSDGKTYANLCQLEFGKCKSGGKLTLQHRQRCRTRQRSPCEYAFCPNDPDALCRPKKWDVTVPEFYNYGVGDKEVIKHDCGTKCSRVCHFDYRPVCSTHFKTYSSLCDLNVAKCESGGKFGFRHVGKCGMHVFIVSYGTIHEKLISKIFINNKSEAQGKRGYNVVVINERTGKVEESKAFDTHGDRGASKAMKNFIQNLANRKIVAVAIQTDGAAKADEEVYEALRMIHGVDPFQHRQFAPFAMIGYKGARKPSWVSQALPTGFEEQLLHEREIKLVDTGEDPDIP